MALLALLVLLVMFGNTPEELEGGGSVGDTVAVGAGVAGWVGDTVAVGAGVAGWVGDTVAVGVNEGGGTVAGPFSMTGR